MDESKIISIADKDTVTISTEEYKELCKRSALLDFILTASDEEEFKYKHQEICQAVSAVLYGKEERDAE